MITNIDDQHRNPNINSRDHHVVGRFRDTYGGVLSLNWSFEVKICHFVVNLVALIMGKNIPERYGMRLSLPNYIIFHKSKRRVCCEIHPERQASRKKESD